MAWVTPSDVAPGDAILASLWNQDVVANTNAIRDAQINVQSSAAVTAATFSTSSATYVDVTGLSVTITPSASTSKILLLAYVNAGTDGVSFWRFTGGNAESFVGAAAGSRVQVAAQAISSGTVIESMNMMYLDSPATTSAVTYKVQCRRGGVTVTTTYLNRSSDDSDNANRARAASIFLALEVPV